ncbi:MAG TPA: hypothetical protein VM345_09790 [Acidimicrobiales bacterium]|nr:hypothetical protein [Acidimicrobiales bacterium]
MPAPDDELRHDPGPEQLWNESWYFDFARPDGSLGGYVRLGLYPNLKVAWYWAYLVGDDVGTLLVRHHEAALPKAPGFEIREDGLWAVQHCETPHEHWTIGLETFAVALDDPADAYRGERGDRVPLGFDLEWEAAGPVYDYPGVTRYEQSCRVSGEILVGSERIEFDGPGQRDHSWGVRDWWRFGWVWTAGALDDGTRFHATQVLVPGVSFSPGYVVGGAYGEELVSVDGFENDVELAGDDTRFPVATGMTLHGLDVTCTPLHLAPVVMEAPDGRVGRLPRALCRFDVADGRSGVGWTEWNQPPAQTRTAAGRGLSSA